MGWWSQNRRGDSFAEEPSVEMVWGDGPADFLDDALAQIKTDFENAHGRPPTCGEIRAGLEFSLQKNDDDVPFDPKEWRFSDV